MLLQQREQAWSVCRYLIIEDELSGALTSVVRQLLTSRTILRPCRISFKPDLSSERQKIYGQEPVVIRNIRGRAIVSPFITHGKKPA